MTDLQLFGVFLSSI